MGYLTTFTVYNDHSDLIIKEPNQFAGKVYGHIGSSEDTSFGIITENTIACNMVHVQRSRHADDHTIYVHMGNCVTEVNPYSREFKELMQRNPDFANKLIEFLEGEVKALKRLQNKENSKKETK